MRKIPITSDWRRAWRWFSMWAFALATALQLVYDRMDALQKESLGPFLPKITILILGLGAAGRMVRQYPENCDECPNHQAEDHDAR